MKEMQATESVTHLLVLHMGPVQSWIAQARRTRDAWFGSHYLSEVSKAAARAVRDAGGRLVFPGRDGDALKPCDTPWYEMFNDESSARSKRLRAPAFNVANKVVAVVGAEPRHLAQKAREAARERWRDIVNDTLAAPRCKPLILDGSEQLIAEQRDTLLEFYAVWAQLRPDEYGHVFDELNRALVARKNLREFKPWVHDPEGRYRSSLDGGRATILRRLPRKTTGGAVRLRQARARLRISDGEQLDAVGLAKRAGGGPDQFIPLTNVAMAEWIRKAHATCPDALEALRAACEAFGKEEKGGFGRVYRPDLEWVSWFDRDASVFREERWEILLEEMKQRGSAVCPAARHARLRPWAEKFVRPVLNRMPPPPSYVACIIADGDRMGETLRTMHGEEQHRAFSRELSTFAADARRIVEREHHGSLVFSGGDDVFGWVSVEHAVPCAVALRKAFEEVMGRAMDRVRDIDDLQAHDEPRPASIPTLSVGIGIGHVMEAMGTLINLGRDAEALAKGDHCPPDARRDALAIVLDKRSGGRLEWRARWDQDPGSRIQEDWKNICLGTLSRGKIHELRKMLARLPDPGGIPTKQHPAWASVLSLELQRILARNESRGGRQEGPVRVEELGIDLATPIPAYPSIHEQVDRLVSRLLIAQELVGSGGWKAEGTQQGRETCRSGGAQ